MGLPLLDLKVDVKAIEREGMPKSCKLYFYYYRKPMANPLLMMEMSAMPAKVKRTTMVQEVVRILRNIRPGLPQEVTTKHLDYFCQRMKASGYNGTTGSRC